MRFTWNHPCSDTVYDRATLIQTTHVYCIYIQYVSMYSIIFVSTSIGLFLQLLCVHTFCYIFAGMNTYIINVYIHTVHVCMYVCLWFPPVYFVMISTVLSIMDLIYTLCCSIHVQ